MSFSNTDNNGLPVVSTTPEIAILYILDPSKLESIEEMKKFHLSIKNTINKLSINKIEYGPVIDTDDISKWCRNLNNRVDGLITITHTGTSARQTAVAAEFKGPILTWYFPETPWWSMASAGSGIGAIRDASDYDDRIKWMSLYKMPENDETFFRLNVFCSCAHTLRAMREEKIGLIGSSYIEFMPASNWHPDILKDRLGPTFTDIPLTELLRMQNSITKDEIDKLISKLTSVMEVDKDPNSMEAIKASAKASLALEKVQKTYKLTGMAINCYGGPDPKKYTGILGNCGASACLKAHATGSAIIGCESDVILTAQQMLFRHLTGKIPVMVDPWKVDFEKGIMIAATCSGPADIVTKLTGGSYKDVQIKRGTLMSLYKVGMLGVVYPSFKPKQPIDMIMARIWGRDLEKMILLSGRLIQTSWDIIPGRLALEMEFDDLKDFLELGCVGNHYTVLPTETPELDMTKLITIANWIDLQIF